MSDESNLTPLLCCPFCGSKAGVIVGQNEFQIIGCLTPDNISMLCPSPSMVVYRDDDGNFDYTLWNKRAT